MKFQKFVKSLGSEGVIYVRKNDERWLASASAFMKIPDNIRSITASDIVPMPEAIESVINYEAFADPCELHKAIMPFPSAGIKYCIRVFAKVNAKDETSEGKALVVKEDSIIPDEDPELVGIIFPIITEKNFKEEKQLWQESL